LRKWQKTDGVRNEGEIVAKRRFRDSGKGRMGEPKNEGKGDWGKEQFERRRRLKI